MNSILADWPRSGGASVRATCQFIIAGLLCDHAICKAMGDSLVLKDVLYIITVRQTNVTAIMIAEVIAQRLLPHR